MRLLFGASVLAFMLLFKEIEKASGSFRSNIGAVHDDTDDEHSRQNEIGAPKPLKTLRFPKSTNKEGYTSKRKESKSTQEDDARRVALYNAGYMTSRVSGFPAPAPAPAPNPISMNQEALDLQNYRPPSILQSFNEPDIDLHLATQVTSDSSKATTKRKYSTRRTRAQIQHERLQKAEQQLQKAQQLLQEQQVNNQEHLGQGIIISFDQQHASWPQPVSQSGNNFYGSHDFSQNPNDGTLNMPMNIPQDQMQGQSQARDRKQLLNELRQIKGYPTQRPKGKGKSVQQSPSHNNQPLNINPVGSYHLPPEAPFLQLSQNQRNAQMQYEQALRDHHAAEERRRQEEQMALQHPNFLYPYGSPYPYPFNPHNSGGPGSDPPFKFLRKK